MTWDRSAEDLRPLHLVAEPGDKRSICGIKKPLPVCWAKFGLVHRRHRPGCVLCFEGAGLHETIEALQPDRSDNHDQ